MHVVLLKKPGVALLVPVAVLLIFALLMAGGQAATTAAETTTLMWAVNETADTPTELQPIIEETARRYAVDPDWLAAAIRTNPGWLHIPVETRRQMLRENRQANEDARKNPCHPDYKGPTPDPAPDCSEYTAPPDLPTDRATLTAQWRASVATWVPQYLAGLYGVASPEQIPQPTDLGAQLKRAWPAGVANRAYETWQILRDYRQATGGAPSEAQAFQGLNDYEDYHWHLDALDWEYQLPVAGATWNNDWHADRPQNTGRAPTRHQGTDLMAPPDTPVVAVTRGQIVKKTWDYLGGWTLQLEEAETGLRFYYAHLSRYADVREGQTVEQGAVLGYIGTSGEGPEGTTDKIQTPHLHFGVYIKAKDAGGHDLVTNPYPYLQAWSGQGDLDDVVVIPVDPPQGWTPVPGFAWPAEGPLTSPFGMRVSPIDGQLRLHAGIDLGVPTGTPIRAAKAGRVVTAGRNPVFGLVVVIDHGDGYETLYAHNSVLNVRVGDQVQQGQQLSLSGSTGWATGPHLHFEVHWQGTPVDPLQLLTHN